MCALRRFLSLLLLLISCSITAEQLTRVPLTDNEFQLMDVVVDGKTRAVTIDGYLHNDLLLIGIEPLFDALTVRYQLHENELIVWKDDAQFVFQLTGHQTDTSSGMWGQDGFYRYVDLDTLSKVFGLEASYDKYRLRLEIKTQDYLFPVQQLELIAKKRELTRLNSAQIDQTRPILPITIDDQYRLYTPPHGYLDTGVSLNDTNRNNYLSLQLVSDLLYHSTSLTITDNNIDELQARLAFSRYKEAPDKPVLGFFDRYTLGDVSGTTNSLTSGSQSGIGVVLSKKPDYFRSQNLLVTLKETAPPGWDMELYHNGRFVLSDVVPGDGLLIIEDLQTEFGNNYFQIKLFGPYGETKVIEKYYDLSKNSLSSGDKAYEFYAIDPNHRLINDQSDYEYGIKNYGGHFDVGISDGWQLGVGFTNTEDLQGNKQQFFNLNNNWAFPGLLFENNISIDQKGGYAQLSTLTGNAIGSDRFSISYQSAKDFYSPRIKAQDGLLQIFNANYYGNINQWNYNFNLGYQDQNERSTLRFSNRISRYFGRVSVSHTLNYLSIKDDSLGQNNVLTNSIDNTSINGVIALSGYLSENLRISAEVNYDPRASDPILDNSSILMKWKLEDSFGLNHYFDGRYRLLDEDKSWQIGHRLAWESKQFQLTLSSSYASDDKWSFLAGFRFFFGYDYYNNRTLFSSRITPASATLDAHTYLDRQLNGIPDPLDYDIAGVSISGNPEWQGIETGQTGRALLPGVLPETPFRFEADWQVGSKTINNDYVVYTHPGAYVEANMPFYLTTELGGFVSRLSQGNEVPMAYADVDLVNAAGGLITQLKTDVDGYFNIKDLQPGEYIVRIAADYMQQRGLTAKTVGYQLSTPDSGGYIELQPIYLERVDSSGKRQEEHIQPLIYDESNHERIVWDNDERVRRNYFNLPPKQEIKAPYSLSHDGDNKDGELSKATDSETTNRQALNRQDPSEIALHDWIADSIASDSLSSMENSSTTQTGLQRARIIRQIDTEQAEAANNQQAIAPVYTIQLGVFSVIDYAHQLVTQLAYLPEKPLVVPFQQRAAQTLYKVVYGQYTDRAAAVAFAAENIGASQPYFVKKIAQPLLINQPAELNVSSLTGWVVQLYAAKSETGWKSELAKWRSINPLFRGVKLINGQTWYCITSEIFPTKADALAFNTKMSLNAWVVPVDKYETLAAIGGTD